MSNNQGHSDGASKLPHDLGRGARKELDRLGGKRNPSGEGLRSDPAAASKIAMLLHRTGVLGLTAESTSDDLEIALRELANGAVTLDPLNRAILREGAIGCLSSIGVNSPARLVDAAVALIADQPAADALESPKPWEDVVDGSSLLFARGGQPCCWMNWILTSTTPMNSEE